MERNIDWFFSGPCNWRKTYLPKTKSQDVLCSVSTLFFCLLPANQATLEIILYVFPSSLLNFFLADMHVYMDVLLSGRVFLHVLIPWLLLCSVGDQPSLVHRPRHFGLVHLQGRVNYTWSRWQCHSSPSRTFLLSTKSSFMTSKYPAKIMGLV